MELDPAYVQAQTLVIIEGASDIRSLGNYPSDSVLGHCQCTGYGAQVSPFPSDEMYGISPVGEAQLKELGSVIFRVMHALWHISRKCSTFAQT